MNRREFLRHTGSAAATLALTATPASAQAYPSRSVTIAVPFSAGSMTDILARTIGQKPWHEMGADRHR